MCFPAWHQAPLVFLFHVLKETNHAANFVKNHLLEPAQIVVFNKSPQIFMDYISILY